MTQFVAFGPMSRVSKEDDFKAGIAVGREDAAGGTAYFYFGPRLDPAGNPRPGVSAPVVDGIASAVISKEFLAGYATGEMVRFAVRVRDAGDHDIEDRDCVIVITED